MSTIKIIVKEAIDVIEEMVPKVARGVAEKSTRLSTKTRQIKQQIEAKDAELSASQRTPDRPRDHDAPDRATPDYGRDADGNPLPYANRSRRPKYAEGQVDDVWHASRGAQVDAIDDGALDLPRPAEGEIWVRRRDGSWRLVDWAPGQNRSGRWDMGHLPGHEYADLHERYMRGELTPEEFLAEYRDPDNYQVEDPLRNRSHDDERRRP